MEILASKINSADPVFQQRCSYQKKLADELDSLLTAIQNGGSPKSKKKHLSRNKLPVRQRVQTIIDPESHFFELSPIAAHQVYDEALPAAGIITGIGYIHNLPCMIIANDPCVKGGSYYPLTIKKHLRAQEIAANNHLPCIYLVDSGGASLPYQSEIFPDRDHFGRIFRNQARMSANGIPQIAAVLGSCTAGGAYIPAMADESIIVEGNGTIFLAGPPLVKAATGELVDAQQLGGAQTHARTSGLVDFVEANEEAALQRVRDCVSHLNMLKQDVPRIPDRAPTSSDLSGLIPTQSNELFNIPDILAALIDASEFQEFKKNYGRNLTCGFAHIGGFPVGILASNGILFSECALKGTHFIELCVQRKVPLLFLQNVCGFMVGHQYEAGGIAKHGAKLVTAVSCAQVPKITIIIGQSIGAGNYALCGRAYDPDFLFMWPGSTISVMGGGIASKVMSDVKQAAGKDFSPYEASQLEEKFKLESVALYSSARLWDDGIILPNQTRDKLITCLDICTRLRPQKQSRFGVFRM
jgi:3-methylcrotonyl-CoA carboxylase beta subunit